MGRAHAGPRARAGPRAGRQDLPHLQPGPEHLLRATSRRPRDGALRLDRPAGPDPAGAALRSASWRLCSRTSTPWRARFRATPRGPPRRPPSGTGRRSRPTSSPRPRRRARASWSTSRRGGVRGRAARRLVAVRACSTSRLRRHGIPDQPDQHRRAAPRRAAPGRLAADRDRAGRGSASACCLDSRCAVIVRRAAEWRSRPTATWHGQARDRRHGAGADGRDRVHAEAARRCARSSTSASRWAR